MQMTESGVPESQLGAFSFSLCLSVSLCSSTWSYDLDQAIARAISNVRGDHLLRPDYAVLRHHGEELRQNWIGGAICRPNCQSLAGIQVERITGEPG